MKTTRKILGLLLMLLLLVGCTTALAEKPEISNATYGGGSWSAPYDHSVWKPLVDFDLNTAANITASIYLEGSETPFNTPQFSDGSTAVNAATAVGNVTLYWSAVDLNGWHPGPGSYDFTVTITAENEDGTFTYDYNFPFNFAHDISQHAAVEPEHTWYPSNTIGLVGLPLRDMDPTLTDKWYNIVPVDLTVNGVQTYDLVASNLFHIGTATVTVQDGNVTVDYALYNGHGYIEDECVAWFNSVEDITTEFLNDPESDLEFGQPVSIANDLNGADTAILFICNQATYRQPYVGEDGYLTRYWPNLEKWILYREGLTALLETIGQ